MFADYLAGHHRHVQVGDCGHTAAVLQAVPRNQVVQTGALYDIYFVVPMVKMSVIFIAVALTNRLMITGAHFLKLS